jgi:hypothetical protein
VTRLSLNKLRSGMVTLSEVIDKSGHTLISANEVLSEKHILLLKMWGVSEVDIKQSNDAINADEFSNEFSPEMVKEVIALADSKFYFHNQESRLVTFLKKQFIDRTLEGGDL